MYLRTIGGLGMVDIFGQRCVPVAGDDSCPAPQWWVKLWGISDTTVGVPPAPAGSVLTVPPASGADAQSTVDTLLNAQLIAQQQANAEGVQSGGLDQAASGIVSAGGAVSSSLMSSIPWGLLGLLGLGAFALMAAGGGSSRRYGR